MRVEGLLEVVLFLAGLEEVVYVVEVVVVVVVVEVAVFGPVGKGGLGLGVDGLEVEPTYDYEEDEQGYCQQQTEVVDDGDPTHSKGCHHCGVVEIDQQKRPTE